MKEAIGGISIFQIAILFILLFTGIMCLTINHAKAFSVKDDIINIIQGEKNPSIKVGSEYQMSPEVSQKIADSLSEAGYRVTGTCPDGYQGYDRNGETQNGRASYCIRVHNISDSFNSDMKRKCANNKCTYAKDDFPKMVYYEVILFYQLDIPIINSIMNFQIYGNTTMMVD